MGLSIADDGDCYLTRRIKQKAREKGELKRVPVDLLVPLTLDQVRRLAALSSPDSPSRAIAPDGGSSVWIVAFLALAFLLYWVVTRRFRSQRRKARLRAQSDLNARLLEEGGLRVD